MNIADRTPRLPGKIEDAYPLSPMQQGMMFHSLLAPGTGIYIEQLLCDLQEVLDEPALRQAWKIVVGRYPVLRTKFRWGDLDEPQQEVQANVELPWEQQDLRGTADAEQDRLMADLLVADRRRGFDMARAPLLRLTLVRYGETKNRLIWTVHHAVLDGRSFAPILREVFSYYEALQAGTEVRLELLGRPYRDYIRWLQKLDFSKAEGFWRRALDGFTEPTPLVVDCVPNKDREVEIRGGDHELWLSTEITSALRSLADRNELTLNTIVQGAWSLLLSRYSHEIDVVFGVTRNCRRSAIEGAEAMVGLFINTLPLRVRVTPEAALIPWLKGLRAQSLAMREHEHTPLGRVQGWSDVPAGTPLFESILVFENFHLNSLLRMQGGPWSTCGFHLFEQSNYPLTLAVYAGTDLCLKIGFDRSRFDDPTVNRMLGHLQTLLEAMAERPQQLLRDLPLLTPAERHQLLVEWNRTEANYPRDLCVHELFEEQVERTPDAVAVEFEERQLTYQELNNRSNQVAHYLRNFGIGPEVLVGLCLDRSLELIVSLFGVLKAGGAYVPVDPAYPAARIAFMLKDANASVVLTQRKLFQLLPRLKAAMIICLDDPEVFVGNDDNPKRTATASNLAYVNYTSGSTGNPKGVMIPHQAIVNVMSWMQSRFPLNKQDCVLQQISISFDPAVLEIFAPLFVGGRLVLARPKGHQDPTYLVRTICQRHVTVIHLVPSTLRMLLQTPELKACHSLRHVFCGGEVLTWDLARSFFDILNAELHYFYGPTEVAITSVFYSVPRENLNEIIPIGRPVANTQAHVLDGHKRHVPIGVPGELYLGGIQVGRGYYNNRELTEERFIGDAFSKVPGARLYKTGDLVRYLLNGEIEFLGRLDHQVKIRGHRIELGEIESVLRLHPAVQDTVVLVREDAPGDKRLVAYVRPAHSIDALVELRRILNDRLPTYMVPAAFVFLDAFPMTPNGKLDRIALPPPDLRPSEELESYVPPRTATEEALVGVWCEFFGMKQVGVRDNFFELGGHSLMIVGMVNRIKQVLRVSLGVYDFYQNPTIEELARVIAAQGPMSKRRTRVVQLQKGKAERPLYFVYTGLHEARLAELTDKSCEIFEIEVPWPLAWRYSVANNQTFAFPTMDQLVAPYLAALTTHTRSTSCVLAGHSFAGLIAFELAQQFHRQGGRVDMVMLFDTWAKYPTVREVAWHRWRQLWKEGPNGFSADQNLRSTESRLRRSWLIGRWMLGQGARKYFPGVFPKATELTSMLDEEGVPMPWWMVERLYTKIRESYRPHPFDGKGVLFRSDSEYKMYTMDDSLGWKSLFIRGLEIVAVVGDHLSMFREHNQTLAQEISGVLERYPNGLNRLGDSGIG